MSDDRMRVFLTRRTPIRIRTKDWPVVASEECHYPGGGGEAKRSWFIELRRNGDACIVIARRTVEETEYGYAAALIEGGKDPVPAMYEVAKDAEVGAALVTLCVRKLPPVDV